MQNALTRPAIRLGLSQGMRELLEFAALHH